MTIPISLAEKSFRVARSCVAELSHEVLLRSLA